MSKGAYSGEDIEVQINLREEEDYVYVVFIGNKQSIPHNSRPVEVYEEEEDALEAMDDYQDQFILSYAQRLPLQ